MVHDIFGLAFDDYLQGNTGQKLMVDVSIGGIEELPVSYFFRSYAQMPNYEQRVLQASKGKVLDVGAGAGSHTLYLQNKGLEVTAVDISPGAVTCMKQRGVKNAHLMDFWQMKDDTYDTLLLLMNGTGMAISLDNLPNLLTHAATLLASGGKIYLESTDLLYMYEEEDGTVLINLAGKYYGEIMYKLSYKDIDGEPFPWLFVDFNSLTEAASLAGLQCELFFEGETDNYIACLYR